MTIRQILTDWTTPAGGGMVSVNYFDATSGVAVQQSAVDDLFDGMKSGLSDQVSWSVRDTGVELDESDGTLVGTWANAAGLSGSGTGASEPVPDSSQILLRWHTASIVHGRFVRGHTYVPGLTLGNVVGGNLGSAAKALFDTEAHAFATSGSDPVVWSRPFAGKVGNPARAGSFHTMDEGTCWSEIAVLRRRRK